MMSTDTEMVIHLFVIHSTLPTLSWSYSMEAFMRCRKEKAIAVKSGDSQRLSSAS